MCTVTEVFESHLAKRLDADVEGDVAENYATDVVFLTGTGAFHGHDGVRQSARELEKFLGKGASFEYRHTLIEGKYAFLEWTATAPGRQVYDGADSFVIEDGKIIFQSIHYSVTRRGRSLR